MNIKKIGKATADSEAGMWLVEVKSERFLMNPRLVDLRPDVKVLKTAYSRHASQTRPSMRRLKAHNQHIQQQKEMKVELQALLRQVYQEILEESFTYPVLLRKDKDAEHKSDWRYCLYQGMVYQFDRPGYGGEEMMEQIKNYEAQHLKPRP